MAPRDLRDTLPERPAEVGAGIREPAPAATCANCGAALVGPYCHRCGQAARPPARSIRGFLGELGADLFHLDSRALRSAASLLIRPGLLTREYLDGRRVRYAHPLQLYLAAAATFFLVNAYRPFVTFDLQTLRVSSALSGATAGVQLSQAEIARRAPGMSLEVFSERFQTTITGYLPTFLIGSVLLFALLLLLFYRTSGRSYLEHAVFALHWTAFYLLLMIVDRLLPAGTGLPVQPILGVVAFIYLSLALRRVYVRPWPGTLARAAGLFVGFQGLLVLWMLSAIALAFALL